MEILEMVWEFLTFERVCLAVIIYFQIELYSTIDSTGKALREIIREESYEINRKFDRINGRLDDLNTESN